MLPSHRMASREAVTMICNTSGLHNQRDAERTACCQRIEIWGWQGDTDANAHCRRSAHLAPVAEGPRVGLSPRLGRPAVKCGPPAYVENL